MEGSQYSIEEMDFMSTDAMETSESQPINLEVSLEDQASKPSNTEELKGMLKYAGTELTVKYLTGQITFEEFSRQLNQSKPVSQGSSASGATHQTSLEPSESSNLPNFEIMMNQDFSGDEEESDEENDDEQGAKEGDESSEFFDSGEFTDSRDKDWRPRNKSKKLEKDKGKKKNSKLEGKQTSVSQDIPRRPRKPRRKMYDLPKIMAGINGRAMLLRAQGKTEEAVELFFEVIKQAPKAAAPYEALGSIQEEKGNMREAIKFYMVAANLRGRYANEWLDIVEMCLKLNDDKLAMTCFVKGLTAARRNEDKLRILARRSAYYAERDNHSKSLQSREQMLIYLDRGNPSNILAFARDLVHDYLEAKDVNGAISVFQFITKEYSHDIDSEDIHSLVELYMDQKSYVRGVETIIRHCGVTATFSSGVPNPEDLCAALDKFVRKEHSLQSIEFPVSLPIDLKSKLLQCLVRMKILPKLDVLKDLVDSIVTMDADDYGDVFYDVAETMVVCDYHETALPILEALVSSEKYNEAAVWLTLGQCRNALGDLPAAIEAYKCVVDMAPGHHEARVTLSSLLQQMGQNEVALQVLSRESEEGQNQGDLELLLHKCQLLHSQGKTKEFMSSTLRLLSLNLPSQFNPEMVKSFMNMKTAKARKYAAFSKRLLNQEQILPDSQSEKYCKGMTQSEKLKFLNNFLDIFYKLCQTLKDEGMNDKLLETTALGITCPIFTLDQTASKNIEFLCLKAGPVSENVYHLARNFVHEECDNPQAWNLYNYILTRMKGVGVDLRFTVRCLMKNPESIPLSILNGNERLISGTYTQALAEYMAVFKRTPDNDMVLLCSAICLLHIASNTHVVRKNSLIIQITCLLSAYREMRGDCQETYYNIGRTWSQLNIQFAAVHYYRKALEFPPAVIDDKGTFDLRREIAYNLSRIYMRSNNHEYARYYIERYCVI